MTSMTTDKELEVRYMYYGAVRLKLTSVNGENAKKIQPTLISIGDHLYIVELEPDMQVPVNYDANGGVTFIMRNTEYDKIHKNFISSNETKKQETPARDDNLAEISEVALTKTDELTIRCTVAELETFAYLRPNLSFHLNSVIVLLRTPTAENLAISLAKLNAIRQTLVSPIFDYFNELYNRLSSISIVKQ